MSNLHSAIGELTRPILLILLTLHGLVHSYTLALIVLMLLIKLARQILDLSTPGHKARRQYEAEREALRRKFNYQLTPELRLQELELAHKHDLPSRNSSAALALSITGTLLSAYGYFGLWYVLNCSPELRGARLLWITDLTAPDPNYVLPLCIFLFFAAGVVSSRRTDPRKGLNWFLILLPPCWAGLNAFLPAGLCFYHLISFFFRPFTTLVLGAPAVVATRIHGLRKRK